MGTRESAAKAAVTNKLKWGEDFYRRIGSLGGKTKKINPAAFKAGEERTVEAGRKGGKISRRSKAINLEEIA